MAYEHSIGFTSLIGHGAASAGLTIALNVAFVYETSGNCGGVRFISPVSQTNGALTVYFVNSAAVTGTPSDIRCAVFDGSAGTDDPDRPKSGAGAIIATSSATDMTGYSTAKTWATFAFASVTLVAGQTYFLLCDNRTGTPGSHYPTLLLGLSGVGPVGPASIRWLFHPQSSTDGITTDPSSPSANTGACVVKFANGTLMGQPWVAATTHANNANTRGQRVRFSEDTVISGVRSEGSAAAALWTAFKIYATDGTELLSATLDRFQVQVGGVVRFAPYTLAAGVSYDLCYVFSGNSTIGQIGNTGAGSIPADVAACVPSWCLGYVDGTPGSFTPDTTKVYGIVLLVDNHPLIDTPVVASVLDTDTVRGATGTIATRTLSAANETVAAGYYAATTLSAVDADLAAANIVSGKTIFGFAGSAAGGGGGGMPVLGGSVVR